MYSCSGSSDGSSVFMQDALPRLCRGHTHKSGLKEAFMTKLLCMGEVSVGGGKSCLISGGSQALQRLQRKPVEDVTLGGGFIHSPTFFHQVFDSIQHQKNLNI